MIVFFVSFTASPINFALPVSSGGDGNEIVFDDADEESLVKGKGTFG